MPNPWFTGTYLPSLFERAGSNHCLWLTVKQTAICTQNMTQRAISVESVNGSYSHLNYTTQWNGRTVTLCFSKKNGCGTITFGSTEAEREAALMLIQAEQSANMKRAAKALKERKPERYTARLESLRRKYAELKEELGYAIEDGDPEWYISSLRKQIAEKYEELKLFEEV